MSQVFCTECGKAFDGEFALSYHRKLVHNIGGSSIYNSEDLEKANKRIKGAAIAGIISGIITLIVAFLGLYESSLWNLLDAALIFGLTFGVYKKNRTCAVILFIYWIVNKVLQLIAGETTIMWWFFMAIFTTYFAQGILGTFSYQKLVKTDKQRIFTEARAYTQTEEPKKLDKSDGSGIDLEYGLKDYVQRKY